MGKIMILIQSIILIILFDIGTCNMAFADNIKLPLGDNYISCPEGYGVDYRACVNYNQDGLIIGCKIECVKNYIPIPKDSYCDEIVYPCCDSNSNKCLQSQIKELKEHVDILAHTYQQLQYQVDIIGEKSK